MKNTKLSSLEKATIAVKLERAACMKAQRQIILGELVPREQVEQEQVARIHAIKSAMMELPKILHREIVRMLREFGKRPVTRKSRAGRRSSVRRRAGR